MKILHLIQKLQNRGVEIFTVQLSNHLIALGHQVKIVALFEGEAKLPFNGEVQVLKASSKNRFIDVLAWKKLASIVEEYRPDIIQANAGDTLKYAVLSKRIFNWKIPLVFRNASEVGCYLKSPAQKSLNSFFYNNVDSIISVSKASEKDILNHFPFLSGKTEVIPVGLESISKIEEIRLKPEGVSHIAHVGGFTFEKNHSGLLKIFSEVLNINPNIHLHLLGGGPLKIRIEEEVNRLGLDQFVTFHGFVNNPLSYIKAADILVLPSIIEGLPGVLLEAMYCRTPVVAFDVGGISEIVTGETGRLIEENNQIDFAYAVCEILKVNKSYSDRIEKAHKMVTTKYMNKNIASSFLNFYQTLL